MSPPAFGDIRAEHFWTLHKLPYGRMMAALPTILTEEIAWGISRDYYHDPSIEGVTTLVRSHYLGVPTPALDAVWAAKGVRGTRADLRAYWETQRLKDLKKVAAKDAGKVVTKATSSPPTVPIPLTTPSSVPETLKVEHYVPNRAELYGYEMWWRDYLLSRPSRKLRELNSPFLSPSILIEPSGATRASP